MAAIVYLIGAGPGDPGLITARGLRCLGLADVVLYDHLVPPRLLRDFGIPASPRTELVESQWVAGDSLVAPRRRSTVDQARGSGGPRST